MMLLFDGIELKQPLKSFSKFYFFVVIRLRAYSQGL